MYKTIPLTQGQFALVDEEDFAWLMQWNWCADYKAQVDIWYAARTRRTSGTLLHRVILGARRGQCVDHINGNGLDNRRSNLRLATYTENAQNRRKARGTFSSQYKGVYWCAPTKKWRAQVQPNRTSVYLGQFDTEESAAKAYDAKARELFGAFALLNFPEEV